MSDLLWALREDISFGQANLLNFDAHSLHVSLCSPKNSWTYVALSLAKITVQSAIYVKM